jgi:hypothetical protein
MWEIFKDAAGSVFGGILAVGTGYWLFWIERRAGAIDGFHASIDDLRAKLAKSRTEPDVFYNESLEVLRRGIIKVRRHSRHRSRRTLQIVFQEYEGLKHWFESPKNVLALIFELEGKGEKQPSVQKFLEHYLSKFDDSV